MTNPLKCNLCAKPATVHLTQIVNNKVHKVDLCEECAQTKGVTDPSGFSLADLLLKASLNPEPSAGAIRCEQCGFTQTDFRKQGRFGCPACYDAFRGLLAPMLDGMHKGVTHSGKIPRAAVQRKSLYARLTKLEKDLTEAIKSERYEEAARYRDEINQVKQSFAPKSPSVDAMTIASLIAASSELTDNASSKTAIVLMTRIRLARNLAGQPFPGWARPAQRTQIMDACREAVGASAPMKRALSVAVEELGELEKQILVERHLISRELSGSAQGSAVLISKDQSFSVMVNEEDHLRIQILRAGFQLKKAWTTINEFDTALEDNLDFAFSPTLGYLTACPTNLGTGMRGSAMMHLPALVMAGQMEKIVRAVNQLGMVVRGLFGEGSDASGSIFQISNQTTLGESEEEIIKRLNSALQSIIEHELNAREKLLEADAGKVFDKVGRAYGILQNSHLLSSSEAMNLLSLIRLGVDLGVFSDAYRSIIDRLFIETQPGHLQYAQKGQFDPSARDLLRASRLRSEFANLTRPDFNSTSSGKN